MVYISIESEQITANSIRKLDSLEKPIDIRRKTLRKSFASITAIATSYADNAAFCEVSFLHSLSQLPRTVPQSIAAEKSIGIDVKDSIVGEFAKLKKLHGSKMSGEQALEERKR